MLKWVDTIPLVPLLGVALLLGVLPLHSTPHLLEKLIMLMQGVLVRPIDIFDLFLHGTPAVLLLIRVTRMAVKK
jgi:hypothetical protein